jgi:hypothetical protein
MPGLVSWQSICLFGALLGTFGVLGYMIDEAARPTHRHVIDGKIVAHDHLDNGRHEHAPETPTTPATPIEGESPERSPTQNQVYQGSTTIPMVDDPSGGLAISPPEVFYRTAAVDAQGARRSPDLKRPPGRGPPASTFSTIS